MSKPEEREPELPPEPERPDCCGGGCAVCVLDGYFEEMQAWRQKVEEIRRGAAEKSGENAA